MSILCNILSFHIHFYKLTPHNMFPYFSIFGKEDIEFSMSKIAPNHLTVRSNPCQSTNVQHNLTHHAKDALKLVTLGRPK